MANENEKSVKLNMVFNAIKGIMGILFPLISFPYVSRVLGVELLGKYNFAVSIISYAILFAALGINTYAIREGSKLRNDKEAFSKFTNEIFTINLISTIFTYIILILLLFIVPKFHDYTIILVILSLQLIFRTIGIEWIYSVFEEYAYITIRSIAFQLLSLILLFVFVKSGEDLEIYAFIAVISSVGSNILNFFLARKYCKVKVIFKINWKKHFKPVMVLFATALMITIYVSSDITILGFLWGDWEVGIYGVSVKVYIVAKTVLASAVVVSIPHLSALTQKKDRVHFVATANDIYLTLLTVVLPTIVGIILLRKEIVLLIAGSEYIEATLSLLILAIALFFSMGAYFWGQSILIPLKQENALLKITLLCAIANIALNFIFIPIWKENGAAFATMISESIAFGYCMWKGKKYVNTKGLFKEVLKIMIGCLTIGLVFALISPLKERLILYSLLAIVLSFIIYFLSQLLLANKAIISVLDGFHNRLKRNI